MKYWPHKRVFVTEYYPNRNFYKSKDQALFVGQFHGLGDSFRSLMQFDLSKIATKDFDQAYLMLDISRNEISRGSSQIGIYRISDSWEERDITWESALSIAAAVPEVTFTVVTGWTGLLIVDLTQLVRRWLEYTYPNHGIVLIGEECVNNLIAINSLAGNSLIRGPHIALYNRPEVNINIPDII